MAGSRLARRRGKARSSASAPVELVEIAEAIGFDPKEAIKVIAKAPKK